MELFLNEFLLETRTNGVVDLYSG